MTGLKVEDGKVAATADVLGPDLAGQPDDELKLGALHVGVTGLATGTEAKPHCVDRARSASGGYLRTDSA